FFKAKGLPVHERNSIIPEPDKPFVIHEAFNKDESNASEEEVFWSMVGQALTGPLAVLLRELRGIRYLGPIRDVPPRNYRSPKTSRESGGAGGLGAGEALVRNPALVEKTSDCLRDILHLGYSIRHEQRLSIDAEGDVMAALRLLAAQYEEKDASYLRAMVLE